MLRLAVTNLDEDLIEPILVSMALYREFASVEALNEQYLPGTSVPNTQEIFASWSTDSERTRSRLGAQCDIGFGPTVDETVDVFPCGTRHAPVHLFIHGGYWYRFSAKEFSFIASRLVEKGITVVINNYSLCPHVTIDEIVRQCRAAVKWIVEHIDAFDGDPDNLTVSGHSAGGQLAAMLANTDWLGRYGIARDFLRGICGLSGLYDLRPFPFTALQPNLQLTCDQIQRNSPIFHVRSAWPPTLLFVGERESPEFHRQSEDFLHELQRHHNGAVMHSVASANHFTILDGFLEIDSRLCGDIVRLCSAG